MLITTDDSQRFFGVAMQSQETIKHIGDALSVSVVVATIASWLPAIAAVMSIIWTAIRIWETETVQNFIQKWMRR